MKKIKVDLDPLDIKRCYLPRSIFKVECPECNHLIKYNEDKNGYLSYPKAGESVNFYLYCNNCNADLYVSGKINYIRIGLTINNEEVEVS